MDIIKKPPRNKIWFHSIIILAKIDRLCFWCLTPKRHHREKCRSKTYSDHDQNHFFEINSKLTQGSSESLDIPSCGRSSADWSSGPWIPGMNIPIWFIIKVMNHDWHDLEQVYMYPSLAFKIWTWAIPLIRSSKIFPSRRYPMGP